MNISNSSALRYESPLMTSQLFLKFSFVISIYILSQENCSTFVASLYIMILPRILVTRQETQATKYQRNFQSLRCCLMKSRFKMLSFTSAKDTKIGLGQTYVMEPQQFTCAVKHLSGKWNADITRKVLNIKHKALSFLWMRNVAISWISGAV